MSDHERDWHDRHYQTESAITSSAVFQRVHDRAAREFLRSTGAGRAHRILSLGCGDGAIERRLAPQVGEIVGFDLSPVAIEQARAKSAGVANLSFHAASHDSLAGYGKFDFIAAFAFLHHLDDAAIGSVLLAARNALRPGGRFYSTDPSRRRLVRVLTGLVRKTYEHYHSPDERELQPETLAAVAARAGFSRPAIGYTDFFLGPLAWLAPGTPRWLALPLEAMDNLALRLPLLRRYASSFSLCAS